MNKFVRFMEIGLDDLYVGKSNVRTDNVNEDIDILADHIYVNGLLEPVVVFAIDDLKKDHELYASRKGKKGKYEILAGQRRYTAYKKINKSHPGKGFDKIPCSVRTPPVDEFDAKAISIGENLTQLPMTLDDSIIACETLFKKYQSEKKVAEKHGISIQLAKRFVKFAKLPEYIQNRYTDIHKSPRTAVKLAVEAYDALDCDRDDPKSVKKVFDFAKRLGKKRQDKEYDEYRALKQAAEENPNASLEVIVAESKKVHNPRTYKIILKPKVADDLESSATEHGNEPEIEGAEIIEEGLQTRISQNK